MNDSRSATERLTRVETEILGLRADATRTSAEVKDDLRRTSEEVKADLIEHARAVREALEAKDAQAAEERYRAANDIAVIHGQLSLIVARQELGAEKNSEIAQKLDKSIEALVVRIVPLEADYVRRSTIWAITRVAIPACFALFTFMWQYGSSVVESISHFLRSSK